MKHDPSHVIHEDAGNKDSRYTRRSLLTWAGSLAAMSMLPACRRPEEQIVPSVTRPEQVVPGIALHYATALAFMGTALGVLVETHEGRPTKVEGNPRHPESLGASSSFLQASIMQLYDADRSRSATLQGQPQGWVAASSMLEQSVQAFKRDQGKSFAILTHDHRSPTLASLIGELKKVLPEASVYGYEPFDRSEVHAGCEIIFGRALEPICGFKNADVVVAFDADPLGLDGSSLRAAREWAARRAPERGPMNRWYVLESSLSITGSVADHRLTCADSQMQGALCALAAELQQLSAVKLDDSLSQAVTARGNQIDDPAMRSNLRVIARDLAAHRGRSLIVVGMRQPKAAHALAHLLNEALGNNNATVNYVRRFDDSLQGVSALRQLAGRMAAGSIQHLLLLGCNPAWDAPPDLDFVQHMSRLKTSIHVGTYRDETAHASVWHINQAHPFEAWGDAISQDGTASVAQPMIAPLFDGHTSIDVLLAMLGRKQTTYDVLRDFWQQRIGQTNFAAAWRRALHDGIVAGTAYAHEATSSAPQRLAALLADVPHVAQSGYELSFALDPHTFDGRFANSSWLHELPEPMTKVTWGNVARISAAVARKYDLSDGDLLTLGIGAHRVHAPVLVAAGQAENTITLTVGHGRTAAGHAAQGIGYDAYPLRQTNSPFFARCDFIERQGGQLALCRTQEQFSMQGRAPVQTALASQFPGMQQHDPVQLSAATRRAHRAWAMTIDLAKCTGCNACAVACQAENNVPVVGADGVRRGRHMHWLRIDRYYEGTGGNLQTYAQPIVCQQCENAPCETVCPAGATSHSPDGLNDMAYNRCVGSRYCANNCPFKVRKFNYFEYWGSVDATQQMQLNPDVTVRSRGVMEKCTFCVQRINAVTINAKRNGTPHVGDGSIVTACEQACPTGAIVFGDWLDRGSRVASTIESPRAYRLLNELNVEPRVIYQASIRNPNPEFNS